MLLTHLTDHLQLSYPIVGAPMAGVAGGRLARAISKAGGLGMIGISSETPLSFIEEESSVARGDDDKRFGLGLMIWAIERRPELLNAAIAAHPFLLSLSFGAPGPYIARCREAGILVATQVNTVAAAQEAEAAGVDLLVAQGTEAGGHTGAVGTLPLLQAVLNAVRIPVLAAGGIASPGGLAAVLAAGAAGAWIGTAFLACPEGTNTQEARQRVVAAHETDTVHTNVFDRAQRIAWPPQYPGRALHNRFSAEWHGRVDELVGDANAAEVYRQARLARDHDIAVIYAGQAAGLITSERPAGEVVRDIGDGAEAMLRRFCSEVL
ncbi:MAG: nitronate monooxygenase [Chloroflexota bacterium]|nr:nitronate monooxygenase [Chloroflexota bacterium]